jgi:hypothetical protein
MQETWNQSTFPLSLVILQDQQAMPFLIWYPWKRRVRIHVSKWSVFMSAAELLQATGLPIGGSLVEYNITRYQPDG